MIREGAGRQGQNDQAPLRECAGDRRPRGTPCETKTAKSINRNKLNKMISSTQENKELDLKILV